MKTILFLIVLFTLVNCMPVLAQEWTEDFESYQSNSFPPSWIPDANATNTATTYVDSTNAVTGKKSLKLYGLLGGCLASIVYHPLQLASPFEIQISVKNGNETLSGCHPDRAGITLRKGTYWSNPNRVLINFDRNGNITDATGDTLQPYSNLIWYSVKIRYEKPALNQIIISYWINGIFKKAETIHTDSLEDQLTNLDLSVQEGTAWFDNITVSNVKQVSVFDVPNDNGKQIFLQWKSNEIPFNGSIKEFTAWRRDNQSWTYLEKIPSIKDSIYQIIVPTIYDSTKTAGMYWSVFRILAHTFDSSSYYSVGIDSGYSKDNLPPLAPVSGTVSQTGNGFIVEWNKAIDALKDFKQYVIYRGNDANFIPSSATRLSYVVDTVFNDNRALLSTLYYYKITSMDYSGNESIPLTLASSTLGITEDETKIPSSYSLSQNYPNPFNPTTTITYDVPKQSQVTIKVYDDLGKQITTLVDAERSPGRYSVTLKAFDLHSGIYFYSMTAGTFQETKKLLLLK